MQVDTLQDSKPQTDNPLDYPGQLGTICCLLPDPFHKDTTMNDTVIHVSAKTGNDQWSGALARPNRSRTDGPLATLEAAQKAVRHIKAQRDIPNAIRVLIADGCYELDRPLRFRPEDGGEIPPHRGNWNDCGKVVSYEAVPGATPVISGGRKISGWKRTKVNGVEAWVADVPEARTGKWNFQQLWVNGQRRFRPSLPRKGEFSFRPIEPSEIKARDKDANIMGFNAGDLDPSWRNLKDVEVLVLTLWVEIRMKIAAIDPKANTVRLDRKSSRPLVQDFSKSPCFYTVHNVFEALAEPGEWYLDRTTGKLYYIPMPGETMKTAEVIAPRLQALVQINGDSKTGKDAGNLHFKGLTFRHTEWTPPSDYSGDHQAAKSVPGAVHLNHAYDCRFEGCAIEHAGSYGLVLEEKSRRNTFVHGHITDTAAGGVRIWHGCDGNLVSDCDIGPGGFMFHSGCGVIIGMASGNEILHNEIHDFYYTGVSVGWTWGFSESCAYGNVIEWNHIHDIGKKMLSDMGGIYCLGYAPGTRLRYNLIHDINARTYGSWCIYPDEGSTHLVVENNICYRTNLQVFHQHYGRENVVRNNIFAYGLKEQIAYSKSESDNCGLIFEHNIVQYDTGALLSSGYSHRRWTQDRVRLDRNVYFCETGKVKFGGADSYFGSRRHPAGYMGESLHFDTALVNPAARGPTANPDPESRDLGIVPDATAFAREWPAETAWKHALALPPFVSNNGDKLPSEGHAEMLKAGDNLFIRVTAKRPTDWRPSAVARVWDKEYCTVILCPSVSALRKGLQIGVSSDGDAECLLQPSSAPVQPDWSFTLDKNPTEWTVVFRIGMKSAAETCQVAATPACALMVACRQAPSEMNMKAWQKTLGQDVHSLEADPLFVNPHKGDFRLKPGSPALKTGFVPFDLSGVGPRKTP